MQRPTASLHAIQVAHTRLVARLIDEATARGFEPVLREAYRPPETAALFASQGRGSRNSVHCDGCAVDVLLFRDGVYCTDVETYRPLGEWWTRQDERARWGGNFTKLRDAVHFSLTPDGKRA